MTNEERKAIEICKEKIIEPFYDFPNPTSIEIKDTDVRVIEIVLSLIKEKDKDIDKKDKQIDLILDKINENYNKIFNSDEVKEIIEIYENIKDKNKLKGLDLRKECIKQYFGELAEKE